VNVASALKTGNHCRVQVDFVSATSCFSGAPIVLEILLPNSRNDGTFETLSAAGELPSGTHAAPYIWNTSASMARRPATASAASIMST